MVCGHFGVVEGDGGGGGGGLCFGFLGFGFFGRALRERSEREC